MGGGTRRLLSLLLGIGLIGAILTVIELIPYEKRIYCPEERVILRWHTRVFKPMERITDHFVRGERPPVTQKIQGREVIGRDGFRVIPGEDEARQVIWMFGGSVVYGVGLRDEDTMGRCLERSLPGTRVVNFGIVGTTSEAAVRILAERLRRTDRPPDGVIFMHGINDSSMGFGRDQDLSKWIIYRSRMILSRFALYHRLRRFMKPAQLDGNYWRKPCRVPLDRYLENHPRARELARDHGAWFLVAQEPYWEHRFWDSEAGRPFYREVQEMRDGPDGIDWRSAVERLVAMGRQDLIFSYYNIPLLEYWTALRSWCREHRVELVSTNESMLSACRRLGIDHGSLFPEIPDPSTGQTTRDCMHPTAWGAEFAVEDLARAIRLRAIR